MLKRLFLRKSKEILDEVISAETLLKDAEDRIAKLKSIDKFTLLREEMLNLIRNSNYISRDIYRELYCNTGFAAKKQSELDNTLTEINECLNEMENLTKEKCNAISQGKESQNS